MYGIVSENVADHSLISDFGANIEVAESGSAPDPGGKLNADPDPGPRQCVRVTVYWRITRRGILPFWEKEEGEGHDYDYRPDN